MPLIRTPAFQYVDTNGVPRRFAEAHFSLTGTTTPTTVYQDSDFQNEHENPVVADSEGIFPPIFFDPAIGLIRCRVIETGGDLNDPLIDADPVNDLGWFGDVYFYFRGGPPEASPDNLLASFYMARHIVWKAGLAGSGGVPCATEPAADYTVTLKQGATTKGTAMYDLSAHEWVFSTTGDAAIDWPAGTVLNIWGPDSADAAIKGFGFTLAGYPVGT